MPAISTGQFNFPAKTAADAFWSGVKVFLDTNPDTSVGIIRVAINKRKVRDVFAKGLTTAFD